LDGDLLGVFIPQSQSAHYIITVLFSGLKFEANTRIKIAQNSSLKTNKTNDIIIIYSADLLLQ